MGSFFCIFVISLIYQYVCFGFFDVGYDVSEGGVGDQGVVDIYVEFEVGVLGQFYVVLCLLFQIWYGYFLFFVVLMDYCDGFFFFLVYLDFVVFG